MSPRDALPTEKTEHARHRLEELRRSYGPIRGRVTWASSLSWIAGLAVVAGVFLFLATR